MIKIRLDRMSDDEHYKTGLNRMRADVIKDTEYEIATDFAVMDCIARKNDA